MNILFFLFSNSTFSINTNNAGILEFSVLMAENRVTYFFIKIIFFNKCQISSTFFENHTSSFRLLLSWIVLIHANMSSLSSAWNRHSQSDVVSRNTFLLFVSLYEMSIRQALTLMGCSSSEGVVCSLLSLYK